MSSRVTLRAMYRYMFKMKSKIRRYSISCDHVVKQQKAYKIKIYLWCAYTVFSVEEPKLFKFQLQLVPCFLLRSSSETILLFWNIKKIICLIQYVVSLRNSNWSTNKYRYFLLSMIFFFNPSFFYCFVYFLYNNKCIITWEEPPHLWERSPWA